MPKPATHRPTLPGVGRLGLVEPQAQADLDGLGWNTEAHVELLWSLSRAADADSALRSVVRLREAMGSEWDELDDTLLRDHSLRGRLFGVLGSSLALADHVIANPNSWHLLAGNVALPSAGELREVFTEQAKEATNAAEAIPPLRTLYRNRLLVLAALDLAPTVENEPVIPFTAVGEHLSDLADAALDAALNVAARSVCGDATPPALAVIAMGKCGARELNYVSDVDIIFVTDDGAHDSLSVATRVAGEMMRLANDAFFEVDAALRPEGKRGQLVRTLESHIAYYQRWAKTWEFQALLKARPAAGDIDLGGRYIEALMPLVWTACERDDFVSEVQAMRRRVEELVPADVRTRELKLGSGGLRDVEFAVQLLQLVHGRNDDELQVASTVDALAALGLGGYIGRDDAANLIASYEFLRLLEHRLQLQRLKRTHMLPEADDEEAMRWLARAAHMRPDGRQDARGVLREELRRHRRRVSRLHAKLFY
ncbi:MAG: bifunctional [glutamine synthetase] adenylyltransferase/[glutamine synthetase]-adenylyl-L-tyrosine phosphorylase, partial [Mycobacterium sp.]